MTKPYQYYEQLRIADFGPDKLIGLCFEGSNFEQVWKETNGQVLPAMPNIPAAESDCKDWRETLAKFSIKYFGDNDEYNMKNPTSKSILDVKKKLTKLFKENPDRKYVILALFASHGIVESGSQCVVVPEYSSKHHWYKKWSVEETFRQFAKSYSNTYSVIVFACCRELHDPSKHCGCFGGTKEEATLKFKEQRNKINENKALQKQENDELIKLREIEIKYNDIINAN